MKKKNGAKISRSNTNALKGQKISQHLLIFHSSYFQKFVLLIETIRLDIFCAWYQRKH